MSWITAIAGFKCNQLIPNVCINSRHCQSWIFISVYIFFCVCFHYAQFMRKAAFFSCISIQRETDSLSLWINVNPLVCWIRGLCARVHHSHRTKWKHFEIKCWHLSSERIIWSHSNSISKNYPFWFLFFCFNLRSFCILRRLWLTLPQMIWHSFHVYEKFT